MQRRIGLTGGIGTGKSTVATMLSQLDIPMVDADQLAREAVRPGTAAYRAIVYRFGDEIVTPDGVLDRDRLGQIVFTQPPERKWLEQQIHPYVRQRLTQWVSERNEAPIVILAIPLLFEAAMTDLVTEIWTVTCHPQQQRDRLHQRDRLAAAEIEARIASQWPLDEKVVRSHRHIDNSGSLNDLERQVRWALG